MSDTQDRDSRTEAPTQRRLEKAREDGEVAKSPEVASAFALAAAALTALGMGGSLAGRIAEALTPFLAHPDSIDLSGRGAVKVLHAAALASAPGLVILAAAASAGVAGNLVQHGVMFTPKRLAPDIKRLNPLSGFKRVFGLDALITAIKSIVKLTAMATIAYAVLRPRAAALQGLSWLDPAAILPFATQTLRALLLCGVLVFLICAAIDFAIQRVRFMRKMRMSREDIKHETKDSEGDPQIKAKLKQQRAARAKSRMIQNVPKATLVIMNPTHFAVALRYVQGETPAPVCVAKGVDEVALKIREVAEAHRIAVVEDPPLARALYAMVDVEETIPREHYQAVAKIVGFLMGAGRRRARPLRTAPSAAVGG